MKSRFALDTKRQPPQSKTFSKVGMQQLDAVQYFLQAPHPSSPVASGRQSLACRFVVHIYVVATTECTNRLNAFLAAPKRLVFDDPDKGHTCTARAMGPDATSDMPAGSSPLQQPAAAFAVDRSRWVKKVLYCKARTSARTQAGSGISTCPSPTADATCPTSIAPYCCGRVTTCCAVVAK